MANTTERIAARVRGLAAEHRFTQQRIAETLKLSRTSVVERINGRIPFSAAEVFELALAMQVSVDRFYPEVSAPSSGDSTPGEGAVLRSA